MAAGPVAKTTFTDYTNISGTTDVKIKKVNIDELRTAISKLQTYAPNVDNCGNCTFNQKNQKNQSLGCQSAVNQACQKLANQGANANNNQAANKCQRCEAQCNCYYGYSCSCGCGS